MSSHLIKKKSEKDMTMRSSSNKGSKHNEVQHPAIISSQSNKQSCDINITEDCHADSVNPFRESASSIPFQINNLSSESAQQ